MKCCDCSKVSSSNIFLFYHCIKLVYFHTNSYWQNMIGIFYWFECLALGSPFCFSLKYTRSQLLFWNISVNKGVFRTKFNIDVQHSPTVIRIQNQVPLLKRRVENPVKKRLSTVIYFSKKLHLRCLTGFWIRVTKSNSSCNQATHYYLQSTI